MSELFRIAPCEGQKDLVTVRKLIIEYAEELGVDLGFQQLAEELRQLPGIYGPPGGNLFLARRERATAGCVALRKRDDQTCEMKRLFVRPAFRNTGLGRLLAVRSIEEGRNMGYRRMVLDTLEHLLPALRLYQDLGFKPCERYYDNPLKGVVYMELPLV